MSVPSVLGEWRKLDAAGREAWLDRVCQRAFDANEACVRTSRSAVTIDGNDFDDLTGFFCTVGEAVNGPGGYFGRNLLGFDDCMFGGFGLEQPFTITWLNSARSRVMLDSAALAHDFGKWIAWVDQEPVDSFNTDLRAYLARTLALAERGERTLFDEIVETIESVPSRSDKPDWTVALRLE